MWGLEVTLNSIMELGEGSDQLDRDAFSSRTIGNILKLFPYQIQDELAKEMRPAKEDGKDKQTPVLVVIRMYISSNAVVSCLFESLFIG